MEKDPWVLVDVRNIYAVLCYGGFLKERWEVGQIVTWEDERDAFIAPWSTVAYRRRWWFLSEDRYRRHERLSVVMMWRAVG